ncbi:MAG: sulfatase [Myxococcota bacterium]
MRRDSIRGAVVGALLGLVHGLADLLSAVATIGWLYDSGWPGIVLVGFAIATGVGIGCLLGTLLGGFLVSRTPRWVAITVFLLVPTIVFPLGVVARQSRNHELAPSPKSASASGSVPVPFLFVVVDTLRADTLFGEEFAFTTAPETGRWASEALIFEDAESTAGWTIPSMASMLTGVHNSTFDASSGRLPVSAKTLAEHFRERGYETRAIVDNVILEPRNGFAQGFESFEQRSAFRFAFTFPTFRIWPIGVHEWLRGSLYSAYDGSQDVTDRAIARVEGAGDAPLFLYVHYMDPHAPYYLHSELADVEGEPMNYYRFRDYLRQGIDKKPNANQLKWLRGSYEKEVLYWDADFRRLVDAWKERYGEEALIVLVSDHGEEFLDHGRLGHGMTVHREMVHVPLILDMPSSLGCRNSGRVSEMVTLLDLAPTLVELASGRTMGPSEDGPRVQGTSWKPWLCDGGQAPETPSFALHARHGRKVYRFRRGDQTAIQVRYFDEPERVEMLWFALDVDPLEQVALSTDDERGRSLFRELSAAARAFESASESLDDENSTAVEESLRALGYIQ